MAKKSGIYVIDTNVFLSDYNCLNAFGPHEIAIPMKVLEEIDKHKKRQDPVGVHARNTIRLLDELRQENSLQNGVEVQSGSKVYVHPFDKSLLPPDLDIGDPDNQIICTALTLKAKYKNKKVIMVSRDVNMRVKCDALGLDCEDYVPNHIVQDTSEIFTGLTTLLVDESVIDSFYAKQEVFLTEEQGKFYPNQFVMLVSNMNEKKSAIARFHSYNKPLTKVSDKREVWGLRPRNKEQAMLMDLLMDPKVSLVTVMGTSGGGKTLLAIASALQQTLEEGAIYNKIVISRPVQPVGRDIGYLPGSEMEKMAPWIAPFMDNLEVLMGNDKQTIDMYIENGTIEVEAITYIRGRSISNAIILIDEIQNCSPHEVKTILTRAGEGTKVILTGDIQQIDVLYHDATSNGLTYVSEKFKEYEIAGHIMLQRGERSALASLSASVL